MTTRPRFFLYIDYTCNRRKRRKKLDATETHEMCREYLVGDYAIETF